VLLLDIPLFTIKSVKQFIVDLSYRKINDWDSKGLLTNSRENKNSGWRKFSILDIIKLRIISDLKQFGFDASRIKTFLNNLHERSFLIYSKNTIAGKDTAKNISSSLEYFTLSSMLGYKIILVIRDENNFYFFDKDKNTCYFNEKETDHIYALFQGYYLNLPFHSYVEEIVDSANSIIKKKRGLSNYEAVYTLTEKEKKILEIIRDKTYQEITITKQNSNEMIIKHKSHRQGNFSDKEIIGIINAKAYQNVTISTVGGKKITLVNEERIRV
jgi:DNA-binding transcriptional MerR regulator